MSIEAKKIYDEIKEYIVNGEYDWELKENSPQEVKDKFARLIELTNCEVIVEDLEEFKSTK